MFPNGLWKLLPEVEKEDVHLCANKNLDKVKKRPVRIAILTAVFSFTILFFFPTEPNSMGVAVSYGLGMAALVINGLGL